MKTANFNPPLPKKIDFIKTKLGFVPLNVKPSAPLSACSVKIEMILADDKRLLFHQPFMLHLSSSCRCYLYFAHTDMRNGIGSLRSFVSSFMNKDALTGSVFIFINKKHNQTKLLLWEVDGL